MKKIYTLILLWVCISIPTILTAKTYNNQTHKVTHFDYSVYTVTYNDENGIEHTVPITDEAFTPEHQMALLQEIYTNPDIPGIHYAYDYNGTQARKINYNTRAHFGGGNWLTQMSGTPNPIPNPVQDGMTLLLVNVKDDWKTSYHDKTSNMVEYFRNAIYSIKLMPYFTRVNDPINPGYLFSVDGASNRFFFISKGKPRASYTKPLYCLFEQISPVDAITTEHSSDSFIDEMKEGHTFTCYHDCTNVFSMKNTTDGHWFSISQSGETFNLDNLSIYIPDRRFEYEKEEESWNWSDDYTANANKWYNEYGNSQNVGSEVWDIMPSTLLYRIKLDAQLDRTYIDEPNKFKVILNWESTITTNLHLPEHFYVYSVDNNGNLTLLTTIPNQPTTSTSCELIVDRYLDPYTLNFMVTGALINYDNNNNIILDSVSGKPLVTIHADSNIKSVLIPGSDPYFTESVEAKSRFLINPQINVYKNKLLFSPTTLQDYQSLKNDDSAFKVIRADNNGNETNIAQIYYELVNDEYHYTVEYNNATQDLVNLYDDEIPVISGSFTDFDNSSITIIDRFSASTVNNDQSDFYTYKLIQDDSDIHTGIHSNICNVTVLKTTCTGDALGISLDEVNADIDHHINSENAVAISMHATDDIFANISQYETYNYVNINKNFINGKAEHIGHTSVYSIYGLNKSSKLNDSQGNVDISVDDEITIIDHNYSQYKIPTYVNVVRTHDDNTYGSNRWSTRFPSLKVEVLNQVKTNPFWNGNGYRMGYETDLKLTPILNAVIDQVYYYRVWRVVTGETILTDEVLLNTLSSVNETTWFNDYEEIKEIIPGNTEKYITDVFLDIPMDGSKKVTYITRMYSRSVANMDEYFITEVQTNVTFNESVITGILDISDNKIIKTEYYDIMGRVNNRPHTGVNIVIKYLRNGGKIISKQIF